MQTLNLVDKTKSTIGYDIYKFPDGQVNIKLHNINRKFDVDVFTIRLASSDDLFILEQCSSILKRQGVSVKILYITYLLCARQDRVIDFDQPYSLEIVANHINEVGAKSVVVVEPHSFRSISLIKNSIGINRGLSFLLSTRFKNVSYCYPDEGAAERYGKFDNAANVFYGTKKRDPETNALSDFELKDVPAPEKIAPEVVVLDDLCDGGGTFCGLIFCIRDAVPEKTKVNLVITHAIQESGITRVANLYDNVYISNSYRDWNEVALPRNVYVFDYETGIIF